MQTIIKKQLGKVQPTVIGCNCVEAWTRDDYNNYNYAQCKVKNASLTGPQTMHTTVYYLEEGEGGIV